MEVNDARELLSSKPRKQLNFPKTVFSEPVTDAQSSEKRTKMANQAAPETRTKMANQAEQMEEIVMTAATQTEFFIEVHTTYEYCERRVNPIQSSYEELIPNLEPPTMTNTHQTQLEASHHLITEGIIATIDESTNTESEEDTRLFRRKLQKNSSPLSGYVSSLPPPRKTEIYNQRD